MTWAVDLVRSWLRETLVAPPLDTRRLVRESAPIAGILLLWTALGAVAPPLVSTGVFVAGLIMAGLYAVVRARALARTHTGPALPDTVEGILRENVRALAPAGVWFLAASVLREVPFLLYVFGGTEFLREVINPVVFAFVGAGVGTVLLYAIVLGLSGSGDEGDAGGGSVAEGGSVAGVASADD